MTLAPITSLDLQGKLRRRGMELSLIDASGNVVVEAAIRQGRQARRSEDRHPQRQERRAGDLGAAIGADIGVV